MGPGSLLTLTMVVVCPESASRNALDAKLVHYLFTISPTCATAVQSYAEVMPMSTGGQGAELAWGVGTVAARLGISPSTLRTWERRYGVGPSLRTAGGHRRYTESDIDRVSLTQRLIERGAPPSDATRVAHALGTRDLAAALEAEKLPVPIETGDAEDVVAEILAATGAHDAVRVGEVVGAVLSRRGVIDTWTAVLSPALVRVGEEWAAGRLGIEAEHLASEAVVGELRAHTRTYDDLDRSVTVILASAEDDRHAIPVFALESALAEAGLGVHLLGSTFPATALASLARQVDPEVVFLWASLERPAGDPVWDVLAGLPRRCTVVLAGPGWPAGVGERPGVTAPHGLRDTVEVIVRVVATTAGATDR
jgi:DNA-binding transcriptional MerR regulator